MEQQPFDGRESWKKSMVDPLYKGKGNVLGVGQLPHNQVAGAWNEGSGMCV